MKDAIRVLLIDDDTAAVASVQRALSEAHTAKPYHVSACNHINEALHFLRHNEAHVLLLGLKPQAKSELSAVKALKAAGINCPIIVLSEQDDHEVAAQAIKLGAQDYLVKGTLEASQIQRSIRCALERHRLERSLIHANVLWRNTFDIVPDPMAIIDKELRIVSLNQAMADSVGLPKETVVGTACLELIKEKKSHFQAFADERPLSEDREHGSEYLDEKLGRRYKVTLAPLHTDKGRLLGKVLIAKDVTDLRESLENNKGLMKRMLEASPLGVGVLSGDSLEYCNQAFIQMFGFETESQLLGVDLHSLLQDNSGAPLHLNSYEAGEACRCQRPLEAKARKVSEELFDVSIWPIPTDFSGKPATLVFLMDISAEKNLRSQLIHSQKMESLGTLAGGIAHDFNNLLTVVLGYSEILLSDEALSAMAKSDIGKIAQAARSGADLIQRLLTFGRKVETKSRPMDLNYELKQLQKILQRTIAKMVKIELKPAESVHQILADPAQVEQVMFNLAVNAEHAMPDGGKLLIETRNLTVDEEYCKLNLEAKSGEYVLLSVSDTGHGMEKEVLEHIFEPFFTTKKQGEGTGLGLSMVFGIVKNHGGFINCYSSPGNGTTFHLYFPAANVEAHQTPDQEWANLPGGSETILLVDDEDMIRDLGQRLLIKAGYEVVSARSGEEALEVYQVHWERIPLVILDLIMPGMGGKKCLEELRKINPRARVLVTSGYSARASIAESISGQVQGFVGKPFNTRELLNSVRTILDS
jgi:two-component system, cell cycle sensor histidine kinase and response regulator CckA